jgi:hypothetical protein
MPACRQPFGIGLIWSKMQPPEKEPLVYHGRLDPISAAFALRYIHTLVRKWAVSELLTAAKVGTRSPGW